jgi:hypothetical protein
MNCRFRGITIDSSKQHDENPDDSIRLNYEIDSNEIDESDARDESRISIERGISISNEIEKL